MYTETATSSDPRAKAFYKTCGGCGTAFTYKAVHGLGRPRRYCTKTCKSRAATARKRTATGSKKRSDMHAAARKRKNEKQNIARQKVRDEQKAKTIWPVSLNNDLPKKVKRSPNVGGPNDSVYTRRGTLKLTDEERSETARKGASLRAKNKAKGLHGKLSKDQKTILRLKEEIEEGQASRDRDTGHAVKKDYSMFKSHQAEKKEMLSTISTIKTELSETKAENRMLKDKLLELLLK